MSLINVFLPNLFTFDEFYNVNFFVLSEGGPCTAGRPFCSTCLRTSVSESLCSVPG